MIRLPRTDYRFAALLQFFCTAAADNLPNRCTCFFAKVYAILILEKTDALNEAVQGHLFLLFPSLHPLKSTEFEGVLLMEKDMNQYVLSLLENYPQMIRKIELMRYELRFAKAVTPQEMIEVMTYAKKGTQVAAEMPRDVPGIALSYRDVTERLNQEMISEALETYMSLLREQDRLLHYVNLLSARECEIITAYYFDQRSWSEISKSLGISPRTAYAIRSQAIDELVTMYSYANRIFAVE